MSDRILVVGGGGREHALAWKLAQSPLVGEIICAPGNGGTAAFFENVPLSFDGLAGLHGLADLAEKRRVDLTVVGPDNALAAGIVDHFSCRALPIFGPTKAAARIESSKAFAKELMGQAGIPTADWRAFTDHAAALAHVRGAMAGGGDNQPAASPRPTKPLVIKASGLALGKGVFICQSLAEAEEALAKLMVRSELGAAGQTVVVEEALAGEELSVHAITDGLDFRIFPLARDHKRAFDGDCGPNTGGMGAYAPVPGVDYGTRCLIACGIVRPAIRALREAGSRFRGCLFPGLMLTARGPAALEYNARFGDPETQALMRLMSSDLYPLLKWAAATDCRTPLPRVDWRSGYAVCVVLASDGYPGPYRMGLEIGGVETAEKLESIVVFHAGTCRDSFGRLLTAGGRVLGVTALGPTLDEASERAYEAVRHISFEGMHYRTDIGR